MFPQQCNTNGNVGGGAFCVVIAEAMKQGPMGKFSQLEVESAVSHCELQACSGSSWLAVRNPHC